MLKELEANRGQRHRENKESHEELCEEESAANSSRAISSRSLMQEGQMFCLYCHLQVNSRILLSKETIRKEVWILTLFIDKRKIFKTRVREQGKKNEMKMEARGEKISQDSLESKILKETSEAKI